MSRIPIYLCVVIALSCCGITPIQADPILRGYRLPRVEVNGQAYYRTYRVTTPSGLHRITSKSAGCFFGGGGQYGEAFYLFRTLHAAKKFVACERSRGVSREVIAEVLLPVATFDRVSKALVSPAVDWGLSYSQPEPRHDQMRDLYHANHILFGKWAQSPHPFYRLEAYDPMIGTKQLAIRQMGTPSILYESIIRPVQ